MGIVLCVIMIGDIGRNHHDYVSKYSSLKIIGETGYNSKNLMFILPCNRE